MNEAMLAENFPAGDINEAPNMPTIARSRRLPGANGGHQPGHQGDALHSQPRATPARDLTGVIRHFGPRAELQATGSVKLATLRASVPHASATSPRASQFRESSSDTSTDVRNDS
jgi:hypothetical protein